MTELFVSVFTASAAIGVATQIAHARHRGRTLSFAFGVIFLFVVINAAPKISFPSLDMDDLISDIPGDGEYYYEVRDAVCLAVGEAVAEKFGFSDGSVSVELINFDFENMKCDTVVVTLSGAAALGDYKRVEQFVSDIGIGRCRVDAQIG